jgi:polyphosphate kinase
MSKEHQQPTYEGELPRDLTDMERHVPHAAKLGNKAYEAELLDLKIELLKLQRWVKESGARVMLVFEGRDAAGKGGCIKRFTESLNPRGARVVALPKPDDTERGQWYFQRYIRHFPTAGEIVFFDRSWYNRAGVEHVMGFCTEHEYSEFFRQAPELERSLVSSGILLFKLWFTVSEAEQRRRFESRRTDPLRQWKLSPMDEASLGRFPDYSKARDRMLAYTDTRDAPWTIVNSNDKKRARLEAIRHVVASIPYDHRDAGVAHDPDPRVVQPASVMVDR